MSTKLFVPTLALRNSERRSGQPGWLGRVLDGLRHEWQVRSAAEDLSAFSDAQLRDIGIARGDIERAVREGR